MTAVHTYCLHGPVLPQTGGNAHSNTVHDIHGGNQRNDSQESVHKQGKGIDSASDLRIPKAFVGKHNILSRKLPDLLCRILGRIPGHLQVNDGIALLSRKPYEGILGADQDPLSAVRIKGALAQDARNRKLTLRSSDIRPDHIPRFKACRIPRSSARFFGPVDGKNAASLFGILKGSLY